MNDINRGEILQVDDIIRDVNVAIPFHVLSTFHHLRYLIITNRADVEVAFEIESATSKDLVTSHRDKQQLPIFPYLEFLQLEYVSCEGRAQDSNCDSLCPSHEALKGPIGRLTMHNSSGKSADCVGKAGAFSYHERVNHTNYTSSLVPKKLKLQFRNKITLPVFSGKPLLSENQTSIEIALVDSLTDQIVNTGNISSAKVEIMAFQVVGHDNDCGSWTVEEIQERIMIKTRK
ncbi:calmodulin-binding protein 60 [Tanacetum coccineum]